MPNFNMWGKALTVMPRIDKTEWDALDIVSRWLIATRIAVVVMTFTSAAFAGLLAAKAGATFISPFVGRHDDNGFDGMQLIEDIRLIYDNYAFETEILVASVRHATHVLQAAKIGADVMTAPPKVIRGLVNHVLTDKGIEGFLKDWQSTGQSIL